LRVTPLTRPHKVCNNPLMPWHLTQTILQARLRADRIRDNAASRDKTTRAIKAIKIMPTARLKDKVIRVARARLRGKVRARAIRLRDKVRDKVKGKVRVARGRLVKAVQMGQVISKTRTTRLTFLVKQ